MGRCVLDNESLAPCLLDDHSGLVRLTEEEMRVNAENSPACLELDVFVLDEVCLVPAGDGRRSSDISHFLYIRVHRLRHGECGRGGPTRVVVVVVCEDGHVAEKEVLVQARRSN
jgi:hypothetical protein